MAAQKLRIKDLSPFDHAAAGHDGVLSDPTGDLIIKPCHPAEIAFYEECATHPTLNALIPTYMGTLALSTTAEQEALQDQIPATIHISEGSVSAVLGSKGKRLDTEQAIVLENLAAGFQKPNVLDVKLGIRLWADDATPEKRNRLDQVSSETTSGSLGLRIAGMRLWEQAQKGAGQYRIYEKDYGRQFTAQNVRKGFEEFFYAKKGEGAEMKRLLTPARREVLRRLSNEVASIEDVLEVKETRMYSSSILFVYEGDEDALDALLAEEQNEETSQRPFSRRDADEAHDDVDDDEDEEDDDLRICAASLIDFAHASFTPGEGKDENSLRGVRNLRAILDSILLAP